MSRTDETSPAEERGYEVIVDATRCVGSATCMILAPGGFAFNEHDQAQPTAEASADLGAVEQASDLCPTQAIRIERTS